MKKYAPASPDPAVLKVTGIVSGIFVLLLTVAGAITALPIPVVIVLYSLAGVLLLALVLGWLARPSRYEVHDDSVVVVRTWPFSRIVIPASQIKEVRHLDIKSPTPASLVIPWIFGYSGDYRNEELGEFVMFATTTRDATLIVAGQKYVITPSNSKRFVKHVHDAMGK